MKNKKIVSVIIIAVILITIGIIAFSHKVGPDEKELKSKRDAILEYIKKNRNLNSSLVASDPTTVQSH